MSGGLAVSCETVSFGDFSWTTSAEQLLGQGSYGAVFVAEAGRDGRKCAAKVYHQPDELGGELRFLMKLDGSMGRESPFPRVLGHMGEGVVGAVFLELMDCNLSQLLVASEPFPSLSVFKQVGSALRHMHSQSIAHLDVKPSNILWLRRPCRAVLADFSLSATFVGESTTTSHTHASLNYRAPELLLLRREYAVRPGTDVWSFGCVAWDAK